MLGVRLWSVVDKARIKFEGFLRDERGDVNIVSIVVLIGIAVLLAIFFQDQIKALLKSLFDTISTNAGNVVKGN
ncbi:MAG: flagellin-like protein [Lachnospiraceae bacterium]|nr:flagellin-like protein [Lachnospiraceae bacterium]